MVTYNPPSLTRRSDLTKQKLSENRQRLVLLGQLLYFGTIHSLQISAGEPLLDPMPRVVRRKKNGGHNRPRSQAGSIDFTLKSEWVEFFRDLDAMGHGVILSIEVCHGLPLIYEFEDVIPV